MRTVTESLQIIQRWPESIFVTFIKIKNKNINENVI